MVIMLLSIVYMFSNTIGTNCQQPGNRVDLFCSNLSWASASLVEGAETEFTFEIGNKGPDDALARKWRYNVTFDSSRVAFGPGPVSIRPRKSCHVAFPYSFLRQGKHLYCVTVEVLNPLEEVDKTNNSVNGTFEVGRKKE